MGTLKTTLHGLAEKFADELLRALRGASLDEILATGDGAQPRRGRLAAASLGSTPSARAPAAAATRGRDAITVETIVGILRKNPKGMRSEHLRKALGAKRGTWRYQMQKAIIEKRVRMHGTKNSAVYFAT
jgi:hypothetical protein